MPSEVGRRSCDSSTSPLVVRCAVRHYFATEHRYVVRMQSMNSVVSITAVLLSLDLRDAPLIL